MQERTSAPSSTLNGLRAYQFDKLLKEVFDTVTFSFTGSDAQEGTSRTIGKNDYVFSRAASDRVTVDMSGVYQITLVKPQNPPEELSPRTELVDGNRYQVLINGCDVLKGSKGEGGVVVSIEDCREILGEIKTDVYMHWEQQRDERYAQEWRELAKRERNKE